MNEGERDLTISIEEEFGLSAVRELLRIISETDVSEISIERGTTRLHIKRGPSLHHHSPAPMFITPSTAAHVQPSAPPIGMVQAPVQTPPPVTPAPEPDALPPGNIIAAPMVGTFYAAPSPKDPPYVQEGDVIHVGDRVGIIEAMKMMNEIESEFAGRVAKILVQNAQPVEYGQPLMVIEPLS
ncbi:MULTISPECIES: acetyl-CoA carboxylase biotin carboxyl carrier protein [Roseiflexus]|jgi:acetyl-CoA carboxylase biotin carboxyl carrier protein|uniref:Biotin carboxyl carrier protein of acetyl-CoA carboxylase n=1 Tax=Roseiflexus castenholzii (strain DSM 13941 / HLO8) TaxID=383372 RepID=A7NN29_ROSCS|nr:MULTISPECIES: acetyl-CoA carboxylase biotin carboxyl carrier protein [Roseiflexus]ABU58961.1 acetyl-CoA carboxylase, biotin carboxyl carrier protein [Roseiflexus castenholzii DSM 13941]PMP73330.1 MAG: acetyl-CoA carboxylase biotin carboxyl carrier protein [Roseiflexus castenholzii]GIW01988.1 MAG: acetyl-CoA carboxylase, biotin carboxyl carrier protein [Roseiflexus sp.]